MSLFTRKMRLLTAVVLDEDKEKVVKGLLSRGVMDFIHIEGLDPEMMKKIRKNEDAPSISELSEYRIRIENLLSQADHRIPSLSSSDLETTEVLDLDKLRRFIERLTVSTQSIKDRQRLVNQRYLTHEEMLRYIDEKKNEYLDIRVGRVPSRAEDFQSRLSQLGSVVDSDGDDFIVLSFKRESGRVDDVFDKFHWTETSNADAQKGALLKAKARLNILIEDDKKDMQALRDEIKEKIGERIDDLEKAWLNVRIHELCGSVESYFSYTKNTTLLSGWVPEDEYESVYQAILEDAHFLLDELGGNTWIKIPVTEDGLAAISTLSREGVHVTAASVFTFSQGMLAYKAGAECVSVYCNRAQDNGIDYTSVISSIKNAFPEKMLLAASFKNTAQAEIASYSGADSLTLKAKVLFSDLKTDLMKKTVDSFKMSWLDAYKKDRIKPE